MADTGSVVDDTLRLSIDYHRHSDGKKDRINIKIKSWKTKKVKDVKLLVQKELQVPWCDQRLSYQGQMLRDELALTDLYLRENDVAELQFLASGELKGMEEFISRLKEFAQMVTDEPARHEEILKIGSDELDSPTIAKYDFVLNALENLAFAFFVPWKNSSTVVQRHYFVQEGGFDAFLTVFSFSHKRYRTESTTEKHKRPWPTRLRKTNERSDLEQIVDNCNNEQRVLEMHCLSLLWNFSETGEDRKHALRLGSLYKVMDALALDPHVVAPEDDEFWVIVSLNETAVGCLVQYAEFPSTQEIITSKSDIVSKLVTMVECRLLRETMFYSLYSSQIAANTLFCCACSIQSAVPLVKNGFHKRMVVLTRQLLDNDHDLALRYYCCLFLARLMCCTKIAIDSQTVQDIDSLLERFLTCHKPHEVSEFEERHNYVWVTMVPFVAIAFAGGTNTKLTAQPGNDEPQQVHTVHTDERTNDEKLRKTGGNQQTLQITPPGSLATQHVGLFCLKHMLSTPQNRLILTKEKLVPYLFNLSWYLHENEKDNLGSVLKKFPCSGPPSLVVLSKTVLALLNGLEVTIAT